MNPALPLCLVFGLFIILAAMEVWKTKGNNMMHYQEKLKFELDAVGWESYQGMPSDFDEDVSTVFVLRAYLPANAVAECEARIEAQRAPRMTADEHNKYRGGRW